MRLCGGSPTSCFAKYNKYAAVVAAAVVCPLVNTGVFLIGCLLFFLDTIKGVGRESWIYQYRIICIFRYGRRKFPVRACLKHDFKPGYTADTQFQREIISYTAKAVVVIFMTAAAFILSKNRKFVFAAVTPHFSFFPRMCGGKTFCKRKTLVQQFFKDTEAGIPVQDGVNFFDTIELL